MFVVLLGVKHNLVRQRDNEPLSHLKLTNEEN